MTVDWEVSYNVIKLGVFSMREAQPLRTCRAVRCKYLIDPLLVRVTVNKHTRPKLIPDIKYQFILSLRFVEIQRF